MTQILKFVWGRVENIVGKGENAGYQHFLLFPQCFLKFSFPRDVKSRDCLIKGEPLSRRFGMVHDYTDFKLFKWRLIES